MVAQKVAQSTAGAQIHFHEHVIVPFVGCQQLYHTLSISKPCLKPNLLTGATITSNDFDRELGVALRVCGGIYYPKAPMAKARVEMKI